jgi:hypothetical protein
MMGLSTFSRGSSRASISLVILYADAVVGKADHVRRERLHIGKGVPAGDSAARETLTRASRRMISAARRGLRASRAWVRLGIETTAVTPARAAASVPV